MVRQIAWMLRTVDRRRAHGQQAEERNPSQHFVGADFLVHESRSLSVNLAPARANRIVTKLNCAYSPTPSSWQSFWPVEFVGFRFPAAEDESRMLHLRVQPILSPALRSCTACRRKGAIFVHLRSPRLADCGLPAGRVAVFAAIATSRSHLSACIPAHAGRRGGDAAQRCFR